MNKTTITPAGVKAILIIASLVPLYMAGYTAIGGYIFSGIFFTALAILTLVHLYYGYKWAKLAVVFLSLAFAITQFFMLKAVFTDVNILLFLFLCVLLIINSLLLFLASPVRIFLSQQAARRSKKVLLNLKLLRWFLFAVIGIGVAKDLMRLLA